jgi:hypothetical protein
MLEEEAIMPVHDWTRVEAGIFHHFHHSWIEEISRALNRGLLPSDYYAMAEQVAGGLGPDVLTLQGPANGTQHGTPRVQRPGAGLALDTAPPKVRYRITDEPKWYATKAKTVAVHHVSDHRVVAIVEIVSPGNKNTKSAFLAFVRKAEELMAAGIHLLIVDLFPPSVRDPEGIHPAIWGADDSGPFRFDPSKPLTCVSYLGGLGPQAFIEPVGVGDALTEMPLCLTPAEYVLVPLEATYQAAFAALPEFWQDVLAL